MSGIAQQLGATAIEASTWGARVLPGAPLIAPARVFVFPHLIPGEEEALARGSIWIDVRPGNSPAFLAQCALGFATGHVAQGLWPLSNGLLAVAGGYGYRIDPHGPEKTVLLPIRPAVAVLQCGPYTVLAGFHNVLVLDGDLAWQSPRISWEGVSLTACEHGVLQGSGWDVATDEEVDFTLDLHTRKMSGGGYRPSSASESASE